MPARGCKIVPVMDKVRTRRPSERTANKRIRRDVGCRMQSGSGMIVTMSLEQSEGVALNTGAECIAHTRQVSATSAVFGPLGVAIGVVCESTMQQQEVILDCVRDNANPALNWNEPGNETKLFTWDFRKDLSFLDDRQFRMLCEFNIKNAQELLNITMRKLLEINLRNDQLQLLLAMMQTEMCNGAKSSDIAAEEDVQTFKKMQEELEKLDGMDDDDERPLVIDESMLVIEESERSLDAIEEHFAKIKNIKVPQTRTLIKGVKTELTDILAELNVKEVKLKRQLQRNKKSTNKLNKTDAVGVSTEEIVTTTTDSGNVLPPSAIKRPKAVRPTIKRRRNAKSNIITKIPNVTATENSVNTQLNADILNKQEPTTTSTELSVLNVVTQSRQNFDVAAAGVDADSLPILDSSTKETALNHIENGRVELVAQPKSLASMNGDDSVAKAASCLTRSSPNVRKHIKKRAAPTQTLNRTTCTANAINLNATECKINVDTQEAKKLDVDTTNTKTNYATTPLLQANNDEPKTLPQECTADTKMVQELGKPKSKSLAAAHSTKPQNLQPTVMLKKLPNFKSTAKESNVDADSTTANIEQIVTLKSDANETMQEDEKPACAVAQSCIVEVKHVTLTETPKEEPADEQLQICAAKDTVTAENFQGEANEANSAKVAQHAHQSVQAIDSAATQTTKCTTPEPESICEPIKNETEELDESGIIMDQHNNNIADKQKITTEHGSLSNDCKLIKDAKKVLSPSTMIIRVNSTPNAKYEDLRLQLQAKRSITFDTKREKNLKCDYNSYDADAIVTLSNTPLSPISNEIASPNTSNIFRDYKVAMEIDACGVDIIYLLKEIDMPRVAVNKPDNLDLLLRKNPTDPRLLKYTKKNNIAVRSTSPLSTYNKPSQNDPRRPLNTIYNNPESFVNPCILQQEPPPQPQTPNMLLYGCLQRSPWYQSLMSTMKIQINQTISVLVRAINNFQKIRIDDPYAVFDIFKLYCAGELLEILENLGLFVDVNGVIAEKKSLSSYAGRTYGCSSVVNATYSFIQPVVEPSTVTVQHQQMRSYTAAATAATVVPATAVAHTGFPATPTAAYQTQVPFISCYIDSPQMVMEKPAHVQQQQQQKSYHDNQQQKSYHDNQQQKPYHDNQQQQHHHQKQHYPRSGRYQPRGSYPPTATPRRHCGLKVPYSYGGGGGGQASARSSGSPKRRQIRYSISPIESDVRSSISPIKREARSSISPIKRDTSSSFLPNKRDTRSSLSPIKRENRSSLSPIKRETRSSISPNKRAARSSISPVKGEVRQSSISPAKQQARCSDSEEESWDVNEN